MEGALLLIAGLALLVWGANFIVQGASNLAASFGISPMIIGLTVVAVGTSFPELAVGITASLQGSGSLAIGNIAGTNMFNILFILGLTAAIAPIALDKQIFRLDLPLAVLSALAMLLLSLDGRLSQFDGGLMFLGAIAYTFILLKIARRDAQAASASRITQSDAPTTPASSRLKNTLFLLSGLVLSIWGAKWLVDGAVDIARLLQWSEAVIGLTIVAIGTSAPELITTLVATYKKQRDVAIGNLLGSSIFNILVILALTVLASPNGITVEKTFLVRDIPLMLGVMLVCIPVFYTGRTVSRKEGIAGVIVYCAYLTYLLIEHGSIQ